MFSLASRIRARFGVAEVTSSTGRRMNRSHAINRDSEITSDSGYRAQVSEAFEQSPDLGRRCDAKGSICAHDGEPAI